MAKTPTQTISGSAPKALADRVQEVARLEDRTPSQVVVSAVDLYTRLPSEAHLALRRIAHLGGEAELEQTLRADHEVVVATPAILLDWLRRGAIVLPSR